MIVFVVFATADSHRDRLCRPSLITLAALSSTHGKATRLAATAATCVSLGYFMERLVQESTVNLDFVAPGGNASHISNSYTMFAFGKADVWQSSTAIVHSLLGEHLGNLDKNQDQLRSW